jgi:hypothetical protein
MQGGMKTYQTVIHTVTNTRYHIDTVISPDDGHRVTRNMYRIEINIQGRNCAPG